MYNEVITRKFTFCMSVNNIAETQADGRLTKTARKPQLDSRTKRKVFWASCLTINIMSREDSFGGNEDEDTRFIVPPLPSRSDKDNSFLTSLDLKSMKCHTNRSRNVS